MTAAAQDPDWARPWFAPYRSVGVPAWSEVRRGLPVHAALNRSGRSPVRFVPAGAAPPELPYESLIDQAGTCPTRGNLHDFFNGLCWLVLPRTKQRMNQLQAGEIARSGIGSVRGPVRDAITIFDENGAVLTAPPPIWEALRQREWRRLFVDLRPLWAQAQLLIVGHALLEKLVAPRKDLTAHVWCAPCPATDPDAVDAWLAGAMDAGVLAAKPFTPLPVLGIPGWCAENENFSFYDDSVVFRPLRSRTASTPSRTPHA